MATFAEVRPDLAKYYKPELNGGKLMSDIVAGSHYKPVLLCDVCSVSQNRTRAMDFTKVNKRNNFKCRHCNYVSYKFPEIAAQWDSEKNGKTVEGVMFGSRDKAWWKCSNGHSWEAQIKSRTSLNRGCPICSVSKGEEIIAKFLKENEIRYIPQYRANERFYDFYIPEGKIFVEVHGSQHFEKHKFFDIYSFEKQLIVDAEKQAYAEVNGKYIMVDYREHNPELALDRFINALAELP